MWKGIWLGVAAVLLPLGFVACSDGELTSDDFDRSCETDSDCIVVFEIGFCCSCQVTAISVSEVEAYETANGCDNCALSCGFFPDARCIDEACRVQRDCAPFVRYACDREECVGGKGIHVCNADGFTFGECTCD